MHVAAAGVKRGAATVPGPRASMRVWHTRPRCLARRP